MDGSVLTPPSDLAGLAEELGRLEALVEAWEPEMRGMAYAYRRAIDALHAEALRRLVRALQGSDAARAALRDAASDEIVYAVLRHHGIVKPSLAERVETALESVRPVLAGHGGDVELVRIEPPRVAIRFIGTCESCPASTLTIDAAVRGAVQAACPEITDIVQVRA
jgi:Fe-S cluster biogenesis protein NfuA